MEGEGEGEGEGEAEELPMILEEQSAKHSSIIDDENPPPQNPNKVSRQEPSPAINKEEILRVLEIVEKDSAAIADSFGSLFSSLRLALSEVTSTSVENMQCFSDIVGSLQESALDASTKGNRYINSCLRLNEELKGMEDLAMHLKTLRKNVDTLDWAVNKLLRFS